MIDDTPASGDTQIAVWGMYDNIEVDQRGEGTGGILIGTGNTTTQYFRNCNIKNFATHAVHAKSDAAGLGFSNCIFECSDPAREFVRLEGVNSTSFSHCHFEGRNLVQGQGFFPYVRITGACRDVALDSCAFTQKSGTNMKAIYVESGARGVSVRSPQIFVPLDSALGEGMHIIVESPPSGVSWEEFRLEGGTLIDAVPGARAIKVYDGSVDLPLGPSSRLRMPALTSEQLANLANKTTGDLAFNPAEGMAQTWDGSSWRSLQYEPSSRLRMPRLTAAQIAALTDKTIGDLLFNESVGKAQVWDGTTWQNLW